MSFRKVAYLPDPFRQSQKKMTAFKDWPLWAQIALVVPIAIAYIPIYFACMLIKECLRDRKFRLSKEYHGLDNNNVV